MANMVTIKVGLIDVDGAKPHGTPFPNLALMKLSAWHKANGDDVEMCFPLARYDRVYENASGRTQSL